MKIEQNDTRYLAKTTENKLGQIHLKTEANQTLNILIVSRDMAEKSWLVNINGEQYLLFSNALVLQNKDFLELQQHTNNIFEIELYPATSMIPKINYGKIELMTSPLKNFTKFSIFLPETKIETIVKKVSDNKLSVVIPQTMPAGINDFFLNVDYKGDDAMAFINGELVADDFYYGKTWQIGLKKLMDMPDHKEMVFYFRPLYAKAPFYEDFSADLIPDFSTNKHFLKINEITIKPEYKVKISF
jgi:beta-galactosidase